MTYRALCWSSSKVIFKDLNYLGFKKLFLHLWSHLCSNFAQLVHFDLSLINHVDLTLLLWYVSVHSHRLKCSQVLDFTAALNLLFTHQALHPPLPFALQVSSLHVTEQWAPPANLTTAQLSTEHHNDNYHPWLQANEKSMLENVWVIWDCKQTVLHLASPGSFVTSVGGVTGCLLCVWIHKCHCINELRGIRF